MKKNKEKSVKKSRESERKTFVSCMKEQKNQFLREMKFSFYVISSLDFDNRNVLRNVFYIRTFITSEAQL